MSVLNLLNKKLSLLEEACPIKTAFELANRLKSSLSPRLGKNFFQTSFDKSDNGNGILFIRFAKHSMEEATNTKLQECPINFIISIEGFRDDGSICDECGFMNVDMFRFQDKTNNLRKMRPQRLSNANMVKDYLCKYFEKYSSHLSEDGEGGGAPAGSVAPAGGTSGGTDSSDIAVFKPKLGEPMGMVKRNWEGKGKKKKKNFSEEQEIMPEKRVGGVPYYFDEEGRLMMLFMVSPEEGAMPEISKGHTEKGEHEYDTLFREIREELGLKKKYVKNVYKAYPLTNKDIDLKWKMLSLYGMELECKPGLTKTCEETDHVVWLSELDLEGFRSDQVYILEKVIEQIKLKHGLK
jgi:8-oxo-dGTP pyrophosphatase MutT (NUDIX family)